MHVVQNFPKVPAVHRRQRNFFSHQLNRGISNGSEAEMLQCGLHYAASLLQVLVIRNWHSFNAFDLY
jgi:hypothetical protein